MKATQTLAVAVALACAPVAGHAQQMTAGGFPASGQVSVGVYGGVGFNTPWFSTAGGDDFGVGTAPMVGLTLTDWIAPSVGVRAHVAYMRTGFPEHGEVPGIDSKINNFLYDADLLLRPFPSNPAPLPSSLYALIGVGAITSNTEGGTTADPACVFAAAYLANGACVKDDAQTKVQGVLGVGADLAPLGSFGALFAEAAVHGHAAPVEVAGGAKDKFVLTPRLSLGVKFRVQ